MKSKRMKNLMITAILLAAMSMSTACGTAATTTGTSLSTTSLPEESASSDSSDTSENSGTASAVVSGTESQLGGLILTADAINFKDSDEYTDYTASSYVSVECDGSTVNVTGTGVTLNGTDITITAEGTYVFSGSLDDGTITVSAGEDAKVTLVLNGFTVKSSSGSAIDVEDADKVIISLPEGTENYVSDADTRADDDEADAAVYSTADLVFNGTGTLTVESNYADAIHGKDDVRILSGNYIIDSSDDGIVGKDRLEIKDGTFEIIAAGHGLKSTNTEDDEKGFIYIENGTFSITSTEDGIHAVTAVWIAGGDFTIDAGDDGIHADETLTIDDGTIYVTESYEGLEAAEIFLNGGDIEVYASDDGINAAGGSLTDDSDTTSEDSTSDTDTDSDADADEAEEIAEQQEELEALNTSSSDENTSSADTSDGSSADETASDDSTDSSTDERAQMAPPNGDTFDDSGRPSMQDGEMPDMSEMPDGEAPDMSEMQDGEAPDMSEMQDGEMPDMSEMQDGEAPDMSEMQDAESDMRGGGKGGMGGGMMNGGGMGGMMGGESIGYLYINGGTITVHADGDGIDANTSIYQNGGTVIVEGPTNDGNGALDYGTAYIVTGGSVLAVGSSGMMQTVSDSSSSNCLTVVWNTMQEAGTEITITDSDGNEVLTYTPSKSFSSFVFADETLTSGETYTVSANGTKLCDVTLNDVVTTVDQDGNATMIRNM